MTRSGTTIVGMVVAVLVMAVASKREIATREVLGAAVTCGDDLAITDSYAVGFRAPSEVRRHFALIAECGVEGSIGLVASEGEMPARSWRTTRSRA